jgi:transcriptional regulator with XRE-family HTH domain
MRHKIISDIEIAKTDGVFNRSKTSAADFRGMTPASLIHLVRRRLGMSRRALAKRAKVPPVHIAWLEAGRNDPRIGTLEKVFAALGCDLILVPHPRRPFKDILVHQAECVAEARMKRVLGTMNLEAQPINASETRKLIKKEKNRLLNNPSTGLWDD